MESIVVNFLYGGEPVLLYTLFNRNVLYMPVLDDTHRRGSPHSSLAHAGKYAFFTWSPDGVQLEELNRNGAQGERRLIASRVYALWGKS